MIYLLNKTRREGFRLPKEQRRSYRHTPARFAALIFFVSVALSPLLLGWFTRYPETIPLALFAAGAAMLGFIPFFMTLTQTKTQEAERWWGTVDLWYKLTPAEFEAYVAALCQARGYQVQLVGGPGDGGIDIWLEKDGQKAIVQCKQYANKKVDVTAVRKFAEVLSRSHAAEGYFVTTSFFTDPAQKKAAQKPVALIDRNALVNWTKEAKAGPYSRPLRYPLFFSVRQWLVLTLLGTGAFGLLGLLMN